MVMVGTEHSAMGHHLNRMISEATDQLMEMNKKDKERLTGEEWLESLRNSKRKETKKASKKTEQDETTETESEEVSISAHKGKNRLAEVMIEEQEVTAEPTSDASGKTAPIEVKPVNKPEKVEIKPRVVAPVTEKVETEEKREAVSVSELDEVQENSVLMKSEEASISSVHGLTDVQQNIKAVFAQIMESDGANSQPDVSSYIEYCITKTRNTFGWVTEIQNGIEIRSSQPDRVTVRSQEKWGDIELAKYYLECLLEDEEFLRYLEPQELLLPKVIVEENSTSYYVKNTQFIEDSLDVFGTFARNRKHEPVTRLLKINTNLVNGLRISNALQQLKGGVTITLDSNTKFPKWIKNTLEDSKLAYAKVVGSELQEQPVTVEKLKFDDNDEPQNENVNQAQTVFPEEKPIVNSEKDSGNYPAHLSKFLHKKSEESEIAHPESEVEAELGGGKERAEEDSSKDETVEDSVGEVVDTPVEKEAIPAESSPEEEVQEETLTEEECRILLKFFTNVVIDKDYKEYLRISKEEQEAYLLIDLREFLQEFDEGSESSMEYKQAVKWATRLKEVFAPLAEIAKVNGYSLEDLREIDYFGDFNLSEDGFPKNANTNYLYMIMLAIQEFYVQAENEELAREEAERVAREEEERLAQVEKEREEAEELEKEREEAERIEAERIEAERIAREEEEREEKSDVEEGDSTERKDVGESDWGEIDALVKEEVVDPNFDLDELFKQQEADSKSKKKRKKREKKVKTDSPIIDLTDDVESESKSSNKKAVAIVGVGVVAFLGLSAGGLVMFNNHLHNKNQTQAQSSQQVQSKVNVLAGALHSDSELSFIDSHNSLKLAKNPYDKLVLAKAKDLTPEQLTKLDINKKATLTISDSGKEQTVSLAGVINDVKDVGVPELKDVSYLKWVDTNNVPYFMPYKG